ncbi:ABC transporter ATP-binding protein [Candidatus Nomurabacteria bacterium]|nr:ABC transporter ATP-binding protein [Candidatus Nomurabacteria bacterium]
MIIAKSLNKIYKNGTLENHVLKDIDVEIQKGEFVAIIGKSGAGKSTLLYQLSLLDHPSSGEIIIDDVAIQKLSSTERTFFRLTNLGYVFQDYALLPELTAAENIMVPLLMQGYSRSKAHSNALKALMDVDLAGKDNSLPSQLSGGEKQRVAIARAIAHSPKILFADEPTANLDSKTSETVLDTFKKLHKDGQTIVMITHESDYAKKAQRIITIDDGKIVKRGKK